MKDLIFIGSGLLLFSLFLSCNNETNLPKTFLLPAGSAGPFRVVFDESCGSQPPVENGRRMLRFDNNGILIVPDEFFNVNEGDRFLIAEGNGKQNEITRVTNKEQVAHKPFIQTGDITVSFYKPIDVNNNTPESRGVTYQDFYLQTETADENNKNSLARLDSLTKQSVEACRK